MTNRLTGVYALALAAVCLVQYLYHLYALGRARRTNQRAREELDQLETALEATLEEGLISKLEIEFLREFVAHTKLPHAVRVLLERFVPQPSAGFAAMFLFQDGRPRIHEARNLSASSRRSLTIDKLTLREVLANGAAVLDRETLAARGWFDQLQENERARLRQLDLLRVGGQDDTVGVVVTTSLYPHDIPRNQQLELARRMMQTVAASVRSARTLESREAELRSTTEILELRSITDRRFPTPLAMVEAFVDRLRRIVGFERGCLYLATSNGQARGRAIVRCGQSLSGGAEGRCREHEEVVANHGLQNPVAVSLLEAEDLARLGVATLLEGAIVAPVRREAITMGAVVLAGRNEIEFDDSRAKLVEWACSHLGDSLDRVLQHADSERRARQDGLTGLANRREFDERIRREVELATMMGNSVALLLIDLDHFKAVNDTHGHRAGDDVLKMTARVLQQGVAHARADDRSLIARYGGEELAIIFPGMNSAGAKRIAESLRVAIESVQVPANGAKITVTASIGTATCPGIASDVESLIAAADAALYRAKELGRNRVVSATPQSA